MNSRVVTAGLLIFIFAVAVWGLAALLVTNLVPASGDAQWAARGQFGDMFGAVTCLLSAITLGFVALSTWDASERYGKSERWRTNYEYAREAKRMIIDHPEVLALHGVPTDSIRSLMGEKGQGWDPEKPTAAQIAYVVLDIESSDLYYKMLDEPKLRLTTYRKRLLKQPMFREIVKSVVLKGTFVDGPFLDEVTRFVSTPD